MSDYEKNCYIFVQNLARELAQDYNIQYQHMEEFARWNLPEEIALEWIDVEGMIDVLECAKDISKETADVLRRIISAFALEFEKSNNSVWTHKAMKTSAFWNMQRLNAIQALDGMTEKTGDGSMSSDDDQQK